MIFTFIKSGKSAQNAKLTEKTQKDSKKTQKRLKKTQKRLKKHKENTFNWHYPHGGDHGNYRALYSKVNELNSS